MEDESAAVEADGNEKSEEPMDVSCEKDVREDVAQKENEVDSSNDRKGARGGIEVERKRAFLSLFGPARKSFVVSCT